MLGAEGDPWALLWGCLGGSLPECWACPMRACGWARWRGPREGRGGLDGREVAAFLLGGIRAQGGGALSGCSHRPPSQPLLCVEGLACYLPPAPRASHILHLLRGRTAASPGPSRSPELLGLKPFAGGRTRPISDSLASPLYDLPPPRPRSLHRP